MYATCDDLNARIGVSEAAQIYPDEFTLEDALSDLQEWFGTFNVVDLDVKTDGAISYTGTGYEVSYPQMAL